MTVYYDYLLLLLTPLWPLLLTVSLALPPLRKHVKALVVTAPLPALLASITLTTDPELALPWLLLGSSLSLDELSRVFLLFSSVLWFAGCVSLPDQGRKHLCGWLLVTMAGNFAVLLAQDIPLFFLSYAVMSLASFGLIIHRQTAGAISAAKVYLVFAVLGEMILLAAVLMVADSAGTLDIEHIKDRTPQHLLLALLFVGFGIKAGVPLLHMALPPAYTSAPLAATVPIAGALFHLGLFGWLRFLPVGQVEIPFWSDLYSAAGVVAVAFAVAAGLMQSKARSVLAYSSISQAGVMMMAIGAGLASADDWPLIESVLVFYALHHALCKGALFYGLGIEGRARLGLWVPALALAGLPFSSGALAKASLKLQVQVLPDFWATMIAWLLPLSSIGTALLMARFLYLAFATEKRDERTASSIWWLLLLALILLPWLWPVPEVPQQALWKTVWPLLLAAVIAGLVYRGKATGFVRSFPRLPPGDILVPLTALCRRFLVPRSGHAEHTRESAAVLQPRATPRGAAVPERFLGRWQVAAALLTMLVIAIYLLLQAAP